MPDLLTHVMIAQGCRMAVRSAGLTPWFLVGTVLPDVLTRPFSIILPRLFWFSMPLHTPTGLFLICALISQLFPASNRRSVFYNLLGGAAVHLLLDMCQKHLAGSYYLFFPLSWRSVEFGLFWPEDSLFLLPLWVGGGLVLGVMALVRRYRHGQAPCRRSGVLPESREQRTSTT
jgi:hypothetical protein